MKPASRDDLAPRWRGRDGTGARASRIGRTFDDARPPLFCRDDSASPTITNGQVECPITLTDREDQIP